MPCLRAQQANWISLNAKRKAGVCELFKYFDVTQRKTWVRFFLRRKNRTQVFRILFT